MYNRILLLLFIFISLQGFVEAQKRYLEPVFDNVDVQTIIYAQNYSVLTGTPTLIPLPADVYTPQGDTETARPLMIYFHTGNFLPHPLNQSPSGKRTDSTAVTLATRFAKMGYVVASADYRLGWNPVAPTQEQRVNTLINAAYRGVQDARSAIRYFKLNAEQFGIDTNKIVLFGQGTGGYITLNTGALSSYSEILNTTMPPDKFKDSTGVPFVFEAFNGNIWGTSYGIINFPGHPLDGDTLSRPNNVGPSSDFQLVVNLGGAIGDISWIDAAMPPVISFQSPTDPFAPYASGVLIVPGQNLDVVEVQGALLVQTRAQQLGLNSAFADVPFVDPISLIAENKNGGLDGLYPFYRPSFVDSSPWDFWDKNTNVNNNTGLLTNPDMSKEKAVMFMDTIVGYYAPRACLVLNLNCDLSELGTRPVSAQDAGLTIAPNPGVDQVTITATNKLIDRIIIYDAAGRAVKAIPQVRSSAYVLERDALPAGVYYAQVIFPGEYSTIRFIFGNK